MSEEKVSLPVAQALASALEKIEAYVPTEYVDNSEPDIDAEHLNHAEQGIMRVTNLLNAAVDVIQGQENRLSDAETKVGTAALTGGMTDLSSGVNSLYSNLTTNTGSKKYYKFPNGLIFAWGVKSYTTDSSKNADWTVNLPISFSAACIIVCPISGNKSRSIEIRPNVSSISGNTFSGIAKVDIADYTGDFSWFVVGV